MAAFLSSMLAAGLERAPTSELKGAAEDVLPGMRQVFKAVQDDVAEVAVKVFKVESEATAEQLQAVRQEIDIIRGTHSAHAACCIPPAVQPCACLICCQPRNVHCVPSSAQKQSWLLFLCRMLLCRLSNSICCFAATRFHAP